jgi:hypothetical protein
MFRRWVTAEDPRSGKYLKLSEDTPARGAGTDLLLTYRDVWPGPIATRVFVEKDSTEPRGKKGIQRQIIRETSQLSPVLSGQPASSHQLDPAPAHPSPGHPEHPDQPGHPDSPVEQVARWLKENDIAEGQYEIFTDGSWKNNTPWLQNIFYGITPADTKGSAAVVCVQIGPDRWTKPGLALHIAPSIGLHLDSGYPAELTALLCACQVALIHRPAAIITDCESAVNIIKRGSIPRAEQNKNNATLARLLARHSRRLSKNLFRHTHSHMDNYVPSQFHSDDERGNILADKVADFDRDWIINWYPRLTIQSTTMIQAHKALISEIPLCVTDGNSPTLKSLHNIFKEQNFKKYLSDRLEGSSKGNFYRDASYAFVSQVFELDKADICQRASCQRLIFDKVF